MTNSTDGTDSGRLWGARFATGPAEAAWALGVSTHFDVELWRQDLSGSRAHATELHRIGVLDDGEVVLMQDGIDRCARLFDDGVFPFIETDEDVHGAIERWLVEELGPLGGKLRAGRSRNDQIANDLRLYLKDSINGLLAEVAGLQTSLCDQAETHLDWLAPGFTHLQRGQPVVLGHHLLAYFWMLNRDAGRLTDCRDRLDVSVLGSGAMAGLTLDLDPEQYRDSLDFGGVIENSMDAVASRDFALEFLSAAAILAVNLSRLGEEIVLWASGEFRFARVGDAFSTGSSIMPQKRNPDVAELVRGKAGRVIGDLMSLLTTVKGLPLAYNRDLQEDKEPVFDAVNTLLLTLPAMAGCVASLTFNRERLAEAAAGDFALATDLAEELVRRGVPFRDAHEIVGEVVKLAESKGVDLDGLDPADLAAAHDSLDEGVAAMLDVQQAVARRNASLGTAPEAVRAQLAKARRAIAAGKTPR